MRNSFVRVAAVAALAVGASSCSTGTQVRNSSFDECCRFVKAESPPEDATELVWCDNKGRNDLVDKNLKNDDKGRHTCADTGDGGDDGDGGDAGGSVESVPPPSDDSTPGQNTVTDSTVSSVPVADTSPARTGDSTVPPQQNTSESTVADVIDDDSVVAILPVRDVFRRVQPEPETVADPVTAVVGGDVDTITVTPDQVDGLVGDSGIENGRVYVRPVVKGGASGFGLVRETVTGDWQEVSPEEGVSLVIGTGAPTVEVQVRPVDGGTDGAVTVAVDVKRVDGAGEGTGSGTITRSFNWWWLLLLLVILVAVGETWRRRRRSSGATV